jgi:hypothetical protein
LDFVCFTPFFTFCFKKKTVFQELQSLNVLDTVLYLKRIKRSKPDRIMNFQKQLKQLVKMIIFPKKAVICTKVTLVGMNSKAENSCAERQAPSKIEQADCPEQI